MVNIGAGHGVAEVAPKRVKLTAVYTVVRMPQEEHSTKVLYLVSM